MFRITSMFCIKVKHRNRYAAERCVRSGHAEPSPLSLCLCGFPPGVSALPNRQNTHLGQLFPPHQSAKPVLKRPDLWGKHLLMKTQSAVRSQAVLHGGFFLTVSFSCKFCGHVLWQDSVVL